MQTFSLLAAHEQPALPVSPSVELGADDAWLWTDVLLDDGDTADDLDDLVAGLGLDHLAVYDAAADHDFPKVDDFGDHQLIVLHGLSSTEVATYEIDCFLRDRLLLTVRREASPAIDALSAQVQNSVELAAGGPDQLLARLFDTMSRRYLTVLDELDRQVDDLTTMALDADPDFLEELTVLRREAAEIRAVLRPQREVADLLRHQQSQLWSDSGRRRLSDVYDLVERSVLEFDAARTAMAEALGAYQGAEAREATEVTKVLTVYAAIMLPLTLIAGIFGMNVGGIPWEQSDSGFWIVAVVMVALTVGSFAVFGAVGWTRVFSPFRTSRRLGRGLVEVLRSPAQVFGVVYERTSTPLRSRRRPPRTEE